MGVGVGVGPTKPSSKLSFVDTIIEVCLGYLQHLRYQDFSCTHPFGLYYVCLLPRAEGRDDTSAQHFQMRLAQTYQQDKSIRGRNDQREKQEYSVNHIDFMSK